MFKVTKIIKNSVFCFFKEKVIHSVSQLNVLPLKRGFFSKINLCSRSSQIATPSPLRFDNMRFKFSTNWTRNLNQGWSRIWAPGFDLSLLHLLSSTHI